MKKKTILLACVSVIMLMITSMVKSHCQIPCGIYDDSMRMDMIAEHITTIEKSMNKINELSSQEKPDMNQLVRWVQNKDDHANQLSEIVTYYFMAQRITPAEKSEGDKYHSYIKKITLLHNMVVSSMKSKQTTDLQHVKDLRSQLEEFKKAYFENSGNDHGHSH